MGGHLVEGFSELMFTGVIDIAVGGALVVTSAHGASPTALLARFAGFSGAGGGGARVGAGGLPLLLLRFRGLLSKLGRLVCRGAERDCPVARRICCLGSA